MRQKVNEYIEKKTNSQFKERKKNHFSDENYIRKSERKN